MNYYFPACSFVLPIEGVGLILWWIIETIINNGSTWWQITEDSLAVTLIEWAVGMLIFIGLNWWMVPLIVPPPKSKFWRRVLGALVKFTPVSPTDSLPPPKLSSGPTVCDHPDQVCCTS